MKMIISIVSNDDSSAVLSGLTKAGYQATKLATTGGFLMTGNTTFIIGTEDDRVDGAIELIRRHCKKRSQVLPSTMPYGVGTYSAMPVEVSVGGATVFVIDVERFEKL
ncbi:MAG: cyclic-di-AMP receptor [Oscillospiraceae bacterium]|nr:transcriptional regulator [Oscillospiraceae bacterium]MBQ8732820.1 cyclic-di-AMP receptor [Oscillospiraceae bacterium]